MGKRHLILFAVLAFFIVSCGGVPYTLINETPPAGDLRTYDTISVGWLDLGEEKYKDYGFEEKDKEKWEATVKDMNLNKLPEFLKEFIPGKTINTVASEAEAPKNEGLIIKFSDVKYNQRTSTAAKVMFGTFAGSDTLDLTVHFIDAQSAQELYSSTISVESKAGTGYSQWGFEGRLTNSVYNLARYISEKTL